MEILAKTLLVSSEFEELGEVFAQKFTPSNENPIVWFWTIWSDRPLDYLSKYKPDGSYEKRTPWEAIKHGDKHLVARYLKHAVA